MLDWRLSASWRGPRQNKERPSLCGMITAGAHAAVPLPHCAGSKQVALLAGDVNPAGGHQAMAGARLGMIVTATDGGRSVGGTPGKGVPSPARA